MTDNRELELLYSRTDELVRRSGVTDACFLNPKEQYFLSERLRGDGLCSRAVFFGGYADAERRMLFLLPDYFLPMLDGLSGDERESTALELMSEETSAAITSISVVGSGYGSLSHRDFMGAVLSLGVERSVIGDIVVRDGYSAVIFCEKKISAYLLDSLTEVGSDKVKTAYFEIPDDFSGGRSYKRTEDTVASERLDCVVSSLASCSRENAKEMILSGGAELNYSEVYKPDMPISEGDVLTIHGVGKFRIVSLSDRTKKGRMRLCADKYL